MRDDMAGVKRRAEASPQLADFVAEAKASDVKHEANGTWTATIRGEENIRRAVQMQKQARAIGVENSQRMKARQATERLVNSRGGVVDVPSHLAERIAVKGGMKPKVNWGRPTESYVVRDGELVRVR